MYESQKPPVGTGGAKTETHVAQAMPVTHADTPGGTPSAHRDSVVVDMQDEPEGVEMVVLIWGASVIVGKAEAGMVVQAARGTHEVVMVLVPEVMVAHEVVVVVKRQLSDVLLERGVRSTVTLAGV